MPATMELDHFVGLINPDPGAVDEMARAFAVAGFPFSRRSGKGTRSFHTFNQYIGSEYFEFWQYYNPADPQLTRPWTDWYTLGMRGIVAIGLRTDNLDALVAELRSRGARVSDPVQPEYPMLRGLIKFRPPWRYGFAAPFEELRLQIFFIEYRRELSGMYRPNSRTANGAQGIHHLQVSGPFRDATRDQLGRLFPDLGPAGLGTARLRHHTIEFVHSAEPAHYAFTAPTTHAARVGQAVHFLNLSVTLTDSAAAPA